MFLSLKKILLGVGSLVGTGGMGLAGGYVVTRKTIIDGLENRRIVSTNKEKEDDLKEVWNKLLNKLKALETGPKSKKFENLKNDTETKNLKELCKNSENVVYSTIFSSDKDFLEDVKSFCTIQIKEVLGDTNLFKEFSKADSNEKNKLNKKLESLKNHPKEEKGVLPKDLENLKAKITDPNQITDDNKKELSDWCGKTYESYFFSKEEDLWKQVEAYCKKN